MAIAFDKLISALAGAVVEANRQIKQTHIGELWRYFKDGSPISTPLQIPRVNPTTGRQEPITVNVPLITLVNPGQLSIQQMQVTMPLDMNDLIEAVKEAPPSATTAADESKTAGYEWKPTQYKPVILVSTTPGKKPTDPGMAQVVLTITAEDPPEALSKLLDHLNKCL